MGAIALVLGAEYVGIATWMMGRLVCSLYIPMSECIRSLNVSSAAAILLYEKLRQEVTPT